MKQSARAYHLLRKYGITEAQYNRLLKLQNGHCALCPRVVEKSGKRLSVDHNHKTGEVRDLLCGQCNIAIGMARENENILKKMIKYLQKHK